MTRSRLTIPQPKSPKSPRSLATCGLMSIKLPRTVLRQNIKKTKKLSLNKRQSTRRNTVKLSARRKRKELRRKTSKNDWQVMFYLFAFTHIKPNYFLKLKQMV